MLGFVAVSVLGASLLLTACSGGGDEEGGYIVTANQYAAGSKSFHIPDNIPLTGTGRLSDT